MVVLLHLPPPTPFQEISSILKELRRVQKQLEGGCGPDMGWVSPRGATRGAGRGRPGVGTGGRAVPAGRPEPPHPHSHQRHRGPQREPGPADWEPGLHGLSPAWEKPAGRPEPVLAPLGPASEELPTAGELRVPWPPGPRLPPRLPPRCRQVPDLGGRGCGSILVPGSSASNASSALCLPPRPFPAADCSPQTPTRAITLWAGASVPRPPP